MVVYAVPSTIVSLLTTVKQCYNAGVVIYTTKSPQMEFRTYIFNIFCDSGSVPNNTKFQESKILKIHLTQRKLAISVPRDC